MCDIKQWVYPQLAVKTACTLVSQWVHYTIVPQVRDCLLWFLVSKRFGPVCQSRIANPTVSHLYSRWNLHTTVHLIHVVDNSLVHSRLCGRAIRAASTVSQQTVSPRWRRNDMFSADGHFGAFQWLGNTVDNDQWQAAYGFLFTPSSVTMALSDFVFGWPYYRSRLWHSVSSVCLRSSVVCDVLYCGKTVRLS